MQLDAPMKPIYVRLGKKKSSKRRYSKGFKDLQRTGRLLARASTRMAQANASGMEAFQKASDKSASKKKDGAMRDLSLNLGKAMRKGLRKSSRIPEDVARAFDTPDSRRATRRQIRALSRFNRAFWR